MQIKENIDNNMHIWKWDKSLYAAKQRESFSYWIFWVLTYQEKPALYLKIYADEVQAVDAVGGEGKSTGCLSSV